MLCMLARLLGIFSFSEYFSAVCSCAFSFVFVVYVSVSLPLLCAVTCLLALYVLFFFCLHLCVLFSASFYLSGYAFVCAFSSIMVVSVLFSLCLCL